MEYENMKVPELKSLVRVRGLRNYSRMRKAQLLCFRIILHHLHEPDHQGLPDLLHHLHQLKLGNL